MRIEFKGVDELMTKLRQVKAKFPRERELFLKQEGELLKARAVELSPADTGYLRDSWERSEVQGDSVEVGNLAEYAQHVEFGHRVKVHGKFTGGVVKGVFMLKDAVEDSSEKFQEDATRILARIFN